MGYAKTAAVLLALLSLAAAPASQPAADDYPALRARLASLTAENAAMAAKIKSLEAELASVRQQLAAAPANAAKPAAAKGRADKLHRMAMDGRTLYHGMLPADVERNFGQPDRKSRTDAGWLWSYAADGYRLDIVITNDAAGVGSFRESGTIPE